MSENKDDERARQRCDALLETSAIIKHNVTAMIHHDRDETTIIMSLLYAALDIMTEDKFYTVEEGEQVRNLFLQMCEGVSTMVIDPLAPPADDETTH